MLNMSMSVLLYCVSNTSVVCKIEVITVGGMMTHLHTNINCVSVCVYARKLLCVFIALNVDV